MNPCHDCPHRKHSENGAVPDGQYRDAVGRFQDRVHPCHNAPTTPCRGHIRDLAGKKDGTLTDSGDLVKSTYTLTVNGVSYPFGETTHDEIKYIRDNPEEALECLALRRSLPVGT